MIDSNIIVFKVMNSFYQFFFFLCGSCFLFYCFENKKKNLYVDLKFYMYQLKIIF